ncbi:MAG: DNA-3-methyladenine glycosylase [Paenibacillus sp.]|nr:DNA-3-methyladenine glycosylase [Paenibacillus sp.]
MQEALEQVRLPVPKPFDFARNLAYLQRSSNECLFRTDDGAVYKALTDGMRAAVWRVSEGEGGELLLERMTEAVPLKDGAGRSGSIVHARGMEAGSRNRIMSDNEAGSAHAGNSLTNAVASAHAGNSLTNAAVAYVREWFDLELDLSPFYRMADGDPLLREPSRQFFGLRLLGIPDLFEALSWGIIGQQINLAFAYTLKRRLVERYGRPIAYNGETYWLFPEPETIAGLTVEELDPLRMTARKSEYLIDTAAAISSGELSRKRLLAAGGLKDAERLLVSRRGIGPWTANYVLMRCLRMPDAFPIDDVGLHNAIKLQTGLGRKPTKPELVEMSAGWAGWEAYATFYLWRLLY